MSPGSARRPTGFAFGQRTVDRADHLRAALAQQGDVGLGGRMQPHAVVHRRADRQRRGAGRHRVLTVIGVALGQPREQIGGTWGDHDAIGPARQFDMAHGLFGGAVPQRGAGRLPGQRTEAERSDELLGTGSHRHLHLGTGVAQAPHQFQGLVGRDPASDAQQQFLTFQRAGRRGRSVGESATGIPVQTRALAYPKVGNVPVPGAHSGRLSADGARLH